MANTFKQNWKDRRAWTVMVIVLGVLAVVAWNWLIRGTSGDAA